VAMQIVHEYERLQAIRLGHPPPPKAPPVKIPKPTAPEHP